MNWLIQLLVAVDQLGNTLLGGWADETISARAYRQRHKLRWRIAHGFINALFFFQQDHCRKAFEAELDRRQLPPAFRKQPGSTT